MFLLCILVAIVAVLAVGGRKTLKPLCHLLSILLMLPSFLFAFACVVMNEATKRTLFYFLDVIISFIEAMYPWGILVLLVCLALLVAAGFRARWRRLAAATVAALVLASAALMHGIAGLPDKDGDWWFFLPGAMSFLLAGLLFITSRPQKGGFVLRYPGGLHIGPGFREDALSVFQGQPGFQRREMGATDWVWYRLPALRDGSVSIAAELGFHDGGLELISLFHDDPVLYGAGGGPGLEDKEHIRAENTRTWLRAKGYPVGHYPWGEVWVGYDPRANFGSGGIRYKMTASRQIPARSVPRTASASTWQPQEMI